MAMAAMAPVIGAPHDLNTPFTACMVVPTGVGASIGGFAGDASMAMNLLAKTCDRLVTHPNVANAAVLQHLPSNVYYTEGATLDAMLTSQWALRAMSHQPIGVVLDAGIPSDARTLTLNAIAACQTIHGVSISGIDTTYEPLQLGFTPMASGNVLGELANHPVLIASAKRLIAHGARAIAIAAFMPELSDDDEAAYKAGGGADPIGALEALLSHAVVKACHVPAAHAPVLSMADSAPETDTLLDPRVAAEFIAPTFLPCVLTGLQQAPAIITNKAEWQPTDITAGTIHAMVLPADCLGGVPALTALEQNTPLILVENNTTTLSMTWPTLMGDAPMPPNVIPVANYAEAAGVLLALKHHFPLSPAIRPTHPPAQATLHGSMAPQPTLAL